MLVIDPQINAGNLITMAIMVVGGIMAFVRLQAQHMSLEARVRLVEAREDKELATLGQHGQMLARISAQLEIIMARCPACQMGPRGKDGGE